MKRRQNRSLTVTARSDWRSHRRAARLLIFLLLFLAVTAGGAERKTRSVVLVTMDGLRWQDLFGGIDPRLMNEKSAGMADAAQLRKELFRDSAEGRREALLPFFWKQLAPRGVVLGNVQKGSSVTVTNSYNFSYPGYAEILTGSAQEAIQSNDPVRNPAETVLEFARKKLNLDRGDVALFGSWDVFRFIGEHTPGSIVINAGYNAFDGGSERSRDVSEIQFQARTPWPEVRHDYVTFELSLDYIRAHKPRLIYIALGEADDWAHAKRYDRVLESIQYLNHCLQALWQTLQAMPEYRDATSLVVTADHGRGDSLKDFSDHGKNVEGSNHIWIAVIGPDTPAVGEATNTPEFHQRDIAPTMLDLLGISPELFKGAKGKAIPMAISR